MYVSTKGNYNGHTHLGPISSRGFDHGDLRLRLNARVRLQGSPLRCQSWNATSVRCLCSLFPRSLVSRRRLSFGSWTPSLFVWWVRAWCSLVSWRVWRSIIIWRRRRSIIIRPTACCSIGWGCCIRVAWWRGRSCPSVVVLGPASDCLLHIFQPLLVIHKPYKPKLVVVDRHHLDVLVWWLVYVWCGYNFPHFVQWDDNLVASHQKIPSCKYQCWTGI